MKGQWLGRFETDGSSGGEGNLLIDIDEFDGAYRGYVVLQSDRETLPIVFARFTTSDTSPNQNPVLTLLYLDPRTFNPVEWNDIAAFFPGITVAPTAAASLELKSDILHVSWTSSLQNGHAEILASQAAKPSILKATRLYDWNEFKELVKAMPPRQYIFRGQHNNKWRLRTTFHRTGRANLEIYSHQDIAQLRKHLSPLTRHLFNLSDVFEFGAFVSLVQHHGYPTPMLDWTHSPYVAAFFAYRGLARTTKEDQFVRIFVFDMKSWSRLPQLLKLAPLPPHLSILDTLAIENPRSLPQQALSTITNVDDIETYVERLETLRSMTFLEAIDLPAREKPKVWQDLAFMGIGAGSLLPGLDGACEQLKDQYFPP